MQEGETFTERLDRLRKLDAQPQSTAAAGAAALPASKRSRKRLRKQWAASAGNSAAKPGKRLGKRQRLALKEQKLGRQKLAAGGTVKAQQPAVKGSRI